MVVPIDQLSESCNTALDSKMVQPKKTGRSTAREEKLIGVRLSLETIRALDRWAERNSVTRAEAVRRLLKSALAASRRATKLKLIRG